MGRPESLVDLIRQKKLSREAREWLREYHPDRLRIAQHMAEPSRLTYRPARSDYDYHPLQGASNPFMNSGIQQAIGGGGAGGTY